MDKVTLDLGHYSPKVWRLLAQETKDPELLERLSRMGDVQTNIEVANNSNTRSSTLLELSWMPQWQVQMAVCRNVLLNRGRIEQLTMSQFKAVSDAAKKALGLT